ncbi:MAG TPA: hypothetical protein VIN73_02760 [Vicingaceae bacterium]
MDKLYQIIASLSTEECRNLKILLTRTNDSEDRKDIMLFDYARKKASSLDEDYIANKLYDTGKNSFYRLKNRLNNDINKSLLFFHYNDNNYFNTLNLISLAKLFNNKEEFQLAHIYLMQAEKKAIKNEFYNLLDLIYNELISLSIKSLKFNPEDYLKKRIENFKVVQIIHEIDHLQATLTYQIKTSQNYTPKKNPDQNILLQQKITELINDPKVKDSQRLQFKVYHSVSRILLQQHDYVALEDYLKNTYQKFTENKLFNKSNHDSKLQMLTYLINSLFKNEKIEESLSYTKDLYVAIQEFDNLHYKKYLFYYYNSLVINYQVFDKQKAISVLEEAKTRKEIQNLTIYSLFIYLNLAVLFFDLKQFNSARKNIAKLKIHESFKNLDKMLQYKISIFELLIISELDDIELFNYQLKNFKKIFKNAFPLKEIKRDNDFVELLIQMKKKNTSVTKEELKKFIKKYKDASESDIINYNEWLNTKIS